MTFPARNKQLCRESYVRDQLLETFHDVTRGFADQVERADRNCDYWEAWNAKLGTGQNYAGNSKVYVPLVRNAIKALRTRFTGQLFPETGRHITVISHDDQRPDALVALLEHYVRFAYLREVVVPALIVAGHVEGQMTLIVSWATYKRHVVERIPEPIRLLGMDMPEEFGTIERLRESEIEDAGPAVEIVLDADLLVRPSTADSIAEALQNGGSVTTLRRWTKSRIEELIEEGELDAEGSEQILTGIASDTLRDLEKTNLDTAGIKEKNRAVVYRTWTRIDVGTGRDKQKRLVLAYFGGPNQVLGCKLCPYWNDECDVLTQAIDKLPGNIKGTSQLKPGVLDMQLGANDAINEGLDQLTYSLLPPLLIDPDQVPNVDSLILDLQAQWLVRNPATSIRPLPFVNTIPQAYEAIAAAERMINMALGVSPALLPQSTTRPGAKPNQAAVALEQQIAIEQTSNFVAGMEVGLMTPMVRKFAEYDAQFRDREKTVQSYGELGLKVEMVTVPPIQQGYRWEYLWFGVEANRTVSQVQQMIAGANVLRGLAQDPSVQLAGKRLNMVPIIQAVVEAAFPARLAGKIFEDVKNTTSVSPELENQLLSRGLPAQTSTVDNDPEHMRAHTQLLQSLQPGTPSHFQTASHIQAHQTQMQLKQQAQMQAQIGQQLQQPGGQARPSRGGGPPRQPMPGAQPAMPRQGRQPQGAIHPDRMLQSGTVVPMPRRM